MIRVSLDGSNLCVWIDGEDLAPRHQSQLEYWGFGYDTKKRAYVCNSFDTSTLVSKLAAYFTSKDLPYSLEDGVHDVLQTQQNASLALNKAMQKGKQLKDGQLDLREIKEFLAFLRGGIRRPLKKHQCKAALHLLCTQNGANFSVPGSGKTAVVLAVFHRLRQLGQIDSLFVVGPPACFGPWLAEYREVLGVEPSYEILAGGDIDARHSKYLVNRNSVCDLYLTTFQTLQRDWQQVRLLFDRQGVRFYLVPDPKN